MNELYPRVYDKMTTDFDNNGLAILEKVYDYRIYERLNGEYTLSFLMPQNDPKMQYVKEENYIKVKGQLFIIRRITETRGEDNTLQAFVECEHIFFELLDKFITNFETNYDTAQFILDRLLFETRFTGTAISVPGSKSFSITQRTAVSGINSILDRWECEIKRDNFNIELKPQIGVVRPAEFKYKKNLKNITKIVDSSNVVTRLYVYGQDGLTIPPLESQYINNYPVPKEGSITFDNVTTTATLQEQGQAYLEKVEVPKVSYEVGIVELKRLTGFEDEEFEIGDTVSVVDEDMGINLTARIVEYEEYPLEEERSTVVMANFIDNITDEMASLRDSKHKVDRVIGENGTVKTFWLEGIIDVLKNGFESAQSNWYTDENGNLIFEATDGSSVMKLAGDGFAIANTKVGGVWQWTTFGTGQGFTANLINAGILNAALVKIIGGNFVSIDGNGFHVIDPNNNERVRAGQIGTNKYGLKITEGEIYGTLFKTGSESATTYIALTPDGNLEAYRNGNRIIFMQANANEGRITLSNPTNQFDGLRMEANFGVDAQQYASVRAIGDRDGLYLSAVSGSSLRLPSSGMGRAALNTPQGLDITLRNGEELWIGSNITVFVHGDITATGQLRAYGGKSAIIPTPNYGERLVYAMEMPELRLMDEGEGELINGICRIDIDPIFLETIEKHSEETPWRIHLTTHDWIQIRVKEIGDTYFSIEEKDGLNGKFTWLFSATRKDYTGVRLTKKE